MRARSRDVAADDPWRSAIGWCVSMVRSPSSSTTSRHHDVQRVSRPLSPRRLRPRFPDEPPRALVLHAAARAGPGSGGIRRVDLIRLVGSRHPYPPESALQLEQGRGRDACQGTRLRAGAVPHPVPTPSPGRSSGKGWRSEEGTSLNGADCGRKTRPTRRRRRLGGRALERRPVQLRERCESDRRQQPVGHLLGSHRSENWVARDDLQRCRKPSSRGGASRGSSSHPGRCASRCSSLRGLSTDLHIVDGELSRPQAAARARS